MDVSLFMKELKILIFDLYSENAQTTIEKYHGVGMKVDAIMDVVKNLN